MKRVAIVGYGGIAPKHIEVLRALGCEIVASVSLHEKSQQEALRDGIPAAYGSVEEMVDREQPDGVVCCPTFDQVALVARELAPRRIPTLLEKPSGTSLAEYNALCQWVAEHRAPQMVGLNRRNYSVVRGAVADAGGFEAVRSVMIDWSEDPPHLRRRGFSEEQISRWVFSNSIHGLDLLTHLAGAVPDPQISAIEGDEPLDWYMSLTGVSERGVLVDFRSSWGSPGRWRVNVCTPGRRYLFAPLESCEVAERGVSQPRNIAPDEFDGRFKPGFHAQAKLFLQMIDEGRAPAGYDLESVRPAMVLAEQLTAACLKASRRSPAGTNGADARGPAAHGPAPRGPAKSF
ncbi:MAG TPA: Gfo/Idh/MocA family oxidoreductase [Pirellulales bacterium]|nr:Gfo/Idh/MocA family oxidoreductase [Pirellulales bacterium]